MNQSFLIFLSAILFGLCPFQAQDDALVAAPDAYKVAFENEYVRVIQVSLAPGQKSPMHTHSSSPLVIIGMSEGRFRLTDATGAVREGQGKFGSVNYSPGHPMKHQSENIGSVPVRDFRVELKAVPPATSFAQDAVRLDPTHNNVELENDRVRVVRVKFGAGEKGPMADKRPRVIVALTDMHAQVMLPDGRKEEREARLGQAMWANAGRQTTENLGDKPFEMLVVELKGKD